MLEQGRIVEQGTHDELLRLNGQYAMLWKHQSGGFLPKDMPQEDPLVIEDAPLDEMRAAEQPEPNINDEPMPARS